jgi:hypothetical protein
LQLGELLFRARLRISLSLLLSSLSLLLSIVGLILLVVSAITRVLPYPGYCDAAEKRAGAIGMGWNAGNDCNDAESTQHQYFGSINNKFHGCIPLERLAGAKN